MNLRPCRALLAGLLVLAPCHGRETAAAWPGPRPAGALHDPSRLLNQGGAGDLFRQLGKIRGDEGVEVIAAVLTDTGARVPEEAVQDMAAAWCDAPLHAVVLHVPGRQASPWIAAGGELLSSLDPDEVRDALAGVRRDASREPDDESRIRSATTGTAEMLRFWKARNRLRDEAIASERARIRLELESRGRRSRILMSTLAAAAVPFLIGAFLAMRSWRKSHHNSP